MGYKMDLVLAGMKTTLISLYISIIALGWPGALSVSSVIFERDVFFWVVGLNSGFKILSKPCCKQMCYHLGFIAPFIVHKRVDLI